MSSFSLIDYAVLAIYLGAMVLLGALFSRRQRSLKEYFHAGGAMPWWAVGISMMADPSAHDQLSGGRRLDLRQGQSLQLRRLPGHVRFRLPGGGHVAASVEPAEGVFDL